jgi:hypothetical protein
LDARLAEAGNSKFKTIVEVDERRTSAQAVRLPSMALDSGTLPE